MFEWLRCDQPTRRTAELQKLDMIPCRKQQRQICWAPKSRMGLKERLKWTCATRLSDEIILGLLSAAMSILNSLGPSAASKVMTMFNKVARTNCSGDGQDKGRLRATTTTHHTWKSSCLVLSNPRSDLVGCAAYSTDGHGLCPGTE